MSIARRLWLSAIVILCLLGGLIGFAYWTATETADAANARREALALMLQIDRIRADLTDAETGQRGYIITGADRYLAPFQAASRVVAADIDQLKAMTKPGELQNRIGQLRELADSKLTELQETIALRREKGFAAALEVVSSDRGKDLMEKIRDLISDMEALQSAMAGQREAELVAIHHKLVIVLLLGGLAVALCVGLNKVLLFRSFFVPLREIGKGIGRVAGGDLDEEIHLSGRDELSRLGMAFNKMMTELRQEKISREHAEEEVSRGNEALLVRSAELEDRTRTIDLLGRMANRLPGCADEAEFIDVICKFAPQILPETPGILYTLNNSQNLLRQIGAWNGPKSSPVEFAPMECWGLRRGQPHSIADVTRDIVCSHVDAAAIGGYRCLPLVAQGETVGLLYLEEVAGHVIDHQDLAVFTETIAFALANMRLRERLKNQSVRDPLTDLFNRRYLEETLELEFSRARRDGRPLSIVMMDVDHFKRFNDLHGHEAGDVVLKSVAQLVKRSIRTGDVACRFGGEEFVLVLPGHGTKEAAIQAERIRAATENLEISHKNVSLGKVTVSLGIAEFPATGDTAAAVTEAADQALYAAKRSGRNRLIIATPMAEAEENAPTDRVIGLPR